MKSINAKLVQGLSALTLVALALANIGCGSSMSSGGDSSVTASGVPITIPTTTSGTVGNGGTAALTATNAALSAYTGGPVDAPTNLAVAVNVVEMGSASNGKGGYDYEFGGTVTISYNDYGNNYTDSFSSHLQGGPNTVNTDTQNNEYNLVSLLYPETSGLPAFHGFFQGVTYCNGYPISPGTYCPGQLFGGAVILVLNNIGLDADGQGATTGSGSVWFYNIVAGNGTGPLPGTSCWFISAGPYDCRTWNSGSGVNTKASLYPNQKYTELGTFTDLDLATAFNGGL